VAAVKKLGKIFGSDVSSGLLLFKSQPEMAKLGLKTAYFVFCL
jgi:hypothetical protein